MLCTVYERFQEATDWIRSSCDDPQTFRILAEPRPESLQVGTRNGRAYMYKGKQYSEFLANCVRQLSFCRNNTTLDGHIIAAYEVIITKTKTTVKVRPSGDVDNLQKGLQDALTQSGIIVDDDNIINAIVHKRWANPGEDAGAIITIGKVKE